MPLFKSKQFSSVIEWADPEPGVLFHRYDNVELKKGSVCIVRPGQDVIILNSGEVMGVFSKDGRYNVESDIIPFLSTIAGVKFGFDTGRRVEALFVNTKDVLQNWGTRSPINIEFPGLPGGIPVRANGNFVCAVDQDSYQVLVENIAGVQTEFSVEDLRERLLGTIEQSLMAHLSQEAGTVRNLQAKVGEISGAILPEVDAETKKYGIRIKDFKVMSFSYPEGVQEKLEQAAGIGLLGNNVAAYQQVALADGLREGGGAAGMAGMFVGAQAGMQMGNNFVANPGQGQMQGMAMGQAAPQQGGAAPTGGGFCVKCGTALPVGAAFCPSCGNKVGG
ncbi:MAG: SPFH domain-containing protein [Lachnospiraceae bacterium]|nr:SPFH domain-containing protein [Lachnospiraceae bacterium]